MHQSMYVLINQTVTSGIKHKHNVTWDLNECVYARFPPSWGYSTFLTAMH